MGNTSNHYRIHNTRTAVVLGVYEGETEAEALDAMAVDAGYGSYDDALALNSHAGDFIACELMATDGRFTLAYLLEHGIN